MKKRIVLQRVGEMIRVSLEVLTKTGDMQWVEWESYETHDITHVPGLYYMYRWTYMVTSLGK